MSLFQVRYATRQAYGRGIYFSEFPDVSIGYGSGLLLCRVLPGREYVDQTARNIPAEYDSKKVQPNQQDSGLMIIVENSDQILPTYIVHLKRFAKIIINNAFLSWLRQIENNNLSVKLKLENWGKYLIISIFKLCQKT